MASTKFLLFLISYIPLHNDQIVTYGQQLKQSFNVKSYDRATKRLFYANNQKFYKSLFSNKNTLLQFKHV